MRVSGVEVVHWNPRKFRVPGTGLRIGPRKMNFGDLLGPLIVAELQERSTAVGRVGGTKDSGTTATSSAGSLTKRLVAVGSIMHFARDRDTVWGTGVNGKISLEQHAFRTLDVRSVRGPLTAGWLKKNKGIDVPPVYGDPGLLVGQLFPELHQVEKTKQLTVIPNLNEEQKYRDHPAFVSPTAPIRRVLRAIAESEMVVGSSLHAMVVADALGIPSALVRSEAEPAFKYEDYYLGSGRTNIRSFTDVSAAIKAVQALKSRETCEPLKNWDGQQLLNSFPRDLWN